MAIGSKLARKQSALERQLYDQSDVLPRRKLLIAFSTLSITLLISFIDQNGISVSLPSIARDLHAQNTISWAGTSSLIANTTFQMLYGRLSDIFGRKRVYLSAVACLAVADLLCGLSRNGPMFYVFRALAGVGGGGIGNLSMIIVSDVVSLEQRGYYQGIIGATIGLSNVIGPFLAAAFTMHSTWRDFFYMLAPLTVAVGCIAAFLLPSNPPTGSLREGVRKIDFLGILSASAAIILVLIPVSGGGSYFRWDSPMTISMLVIGVLLGVLFVIIELRVAHLPMIPMSIFKSPVICVLVAQSFLLGAGYQVLLYYIPLFLQNAHQYSVLASAGINATSVSVQSVSSVLWGLYISRWKRYDHPIWFGFATWTLGLCLLLINKRHMNLASIIVPLMICGGGVGATLQPSLVALQANTTKARRAVIISVRNFSRATGGAVGLAVAAAVLQAGLRSHLPANYSYLADSAFYLPSNFESLEAQEAVLDAYMAASRDVIIMLIPFTGLSLVLCIFIKDRGLEPTDERESRLKAEAEAAAAAAAAAAGSTAVVEMGVLTTSTEKSPVAVDRDVETGDVVEAETETGDDSESFNDTQNTGEERKERKEKEREEV